MPNILQFTEPQTISVGNCIERFRKLNEEFKNFIHEHNLCTINEKFVGACNGDSGGPLAYDSETHTKTLVGIVSWGALGVSITLLFRFIAIFRLMIAKCSI